MGVSAIMEALSFLQYVNRLHEKEFPVDDQLKEIIRHSSEAFSKEFTINNGEDILQRLMFNPGVISGGEKANIVAQHCDLGLELRIPWGCDIPNLVADLKAHAPNGTVTSETINEPSLTSPGCDFVSIVCENVQNVYGGDIFPIVQWAASDARHLRCAGFNVIEYGPGELSTLHAVNERVSIASLEHASEIYQGIMKAYR